MSFLAPVVDNYRKALEAIGLDADAMLEEVGIDVADAATASGRVEYAAVDRLRALAAERGRCPSFGIELARHMQAAHLGTMGLAWLNSRSLRTALERFQRYSRVFNEQVTVGLHDDDDQLIYTLSVEKPSLNDGVRFDAGLATTVAMCRMTAGDDFSPHSVSFVHDAPADPADWFEYFRSPVHFAADANCLAIRHEDADRPLPTFNPNLANALDAEIVRYLAQHDRDDIVSRVRSEIIEQLPSGGVSERSVAEALHMTERTVHRRLSEHDTSFRSLLNEVRNELAMRYVADPGLTLTEISFLLGFSEASAFSRAFRRWTGQAPSEARRQAD